MYIRLIFLATVFFCACTAHNTVLITKAEQPAPF